jgi:hypothetical protein
MRENLVREQRGSGCVVSLQKTDENGFPNEGDVVRNWWQGLVCVALMVGCSKSPETTPASKAAEGSVADSGSAVQSPLLGGAKVKAGDFRVSVRDGRVLLPGLSLALPKGWSLDSQATSPRLANLVAPGGVQVAVFWFGPKAGGTIDENLQRWEGFFSPIWLREIERDTVKQPPLVWGRWRGKYQSTMGAPSNHGSDTTEMLAAIVPSGQGSVFFKAVGSVAAMEAIRTSLQGMLKVAKLEG